MAVNWTPEQKNAIEARGGSLLVSAAAGSGKTAVLSQRVISLMTDPDHPVDADRLLVVTFSRAAAAEMRQRIAQKLWELQEERPADRGLRRQQLLLEQANISTMHAFCQELVRQNFHLLGIGPDFRIADDKELKLLRAQAVEETLASFYEEGSETFYRLVELVSGTRGDRRMEETVLRLYDFLRSHAFYQEWLREKLDLYDPDIPPEESIWGAELMQYALEGLYFALSATRQALLEVEGDSVMEEAYGPALRCDWEMLTQWRDLLNQKDWNGFVKALRRGKLTSLKALRGYEDEERKSRVKDLRGQVKKMVEELSEKRFCATSWEHREDMEELRPMVKMLFQVVEHFDRNLQEKKEDRGLMDFSDLEHYALRLLWEKGEDGVYHTTPAARAAAQRYEEVLVDEFQDTNDAQETIFQAISREGKNRFMVGDVKQSIYRFRQAMPEIFIAKQKEAVPYDGEHFPAKIVLGKNFRSRAEVTSFVNQLFEMLMSPSVGELEYGEEERLQAAASYPPWEGEAPVQLHLLEEGAPSEADYVAALVERLLKEGETVDAGGSRRPIQPGDICVLMRSFRQRAEEFLKAFQKRGIPAWANSEGGLLATAEAAPVVAFLKVLDNPLLDLELFHLLLSPMVGFSADRIAQVRKGRKDRPLFLCLRDEAQAGGEDCARFLKMLEQLRRESAVHTAREMVFRLYDATGYLPVVRAMEFGETRLANLRLLADHIAAYEERGYQGVGGIVRMFAFLEQQGEELPAATLPAEDAVQMMSIHASKGLEFPVVILADMARQFNHSDQQRSTLLHSRLGFACMRRDQEKGIQYSTLPMEAIKVAERKGALSEELRVLYVALTRARERLFLVGRLKSGWEKKLAAQAYPLDEKGRLPSWAVGGAQNLLQWVEMAALHLEGGEELRQRAGIHCQVRPGQGEKFSCQVIFQEEAPSKAPEEIPREKPKADPFMMEEIQRRLAWRYPFEEATRLPSKLAVSEIAKGNEEAFAYTPRPDFLQEKGLNAGEKGTILHRFMQFADYEKAARGPGEEIARLTALRYFTPEEGAAIDPEQLRRFFASPLAERIFAARRVYREIRFLCEGDESILGPYYPLPQGEATVIQGVADCVFVEEGGAVVVDYKTDQGKTDEAFLARYTPQLEIYARVLEKMLEMPVKECVLYSFAKGEEIRIR